MVPEAEVCELAKASWSQTNRELDRLVKRELARTSVPGVSVGIYHKGRKFISSHGVTNVDHPLPVTPDTLFQIGSTTKTYTATAIMKLVEEGKADLDVPVRRYIPGFKLRDPEATRKVTLRHLLTHTGGWIGDYFFRGGGWGDDALERVVKSMATIKQLTPLGTVWHYSNSGFYIAGRVLERLTKKPYEIAIRDMLFTPLGMEESFFFPHEIMTRRFVVGHVTVGKKSQAATMYRGSRGGAPAGAIVSSAGDQLKWAEFHMGDGKGPDGKRLLKKSTLRMMQTEQLHVGSMTEGMGISWMLNTAGGVKLVRHGGTTLGQLSAFVMAPEEQFAVTSLTNSTRGREINPVVVRWALENYIGLSEAPPEPWPVTSTELEKYTGKYRVESSGQVIDVTARAGKLHIKFPDAGGRGRRRAPSMPPLPVHFYAPDRFIGSSGPYGGVRGDFVRSPSGRIQWMRFGGRLYRKVSERTAAKAVAHAG